MSSFTQTVDIYIGLEVDHLDFSCGYWAIGAPLFLGSDHLQRKQLIHHAALIRVRESRHSLPDSMYTALKHSDMARV